MIATRWTHASSHSLRHNKFSFPILFVLSRMLALYFPLFSMFRGLEYRASGLTLREIYMNAESIQIPHSTLFICKPKHDLLKIYLFVCLFKYVCLCI